MPSRSGISRYSLAHILFTLSTAMMARLSQISSANGLRIKPLETDTDVIGLKQRSYESDRVFLTKQRRFIRIELNYSL